MTESEYLEVNQLAECEGFDYCFRYYTDFKDIKDDKFHQLRLAYIEAANNLERYIECL
jgi:hypothetical protein